MLNYDMTQEKYELRSHNEDRQKFNTMSYV